MAISEDNLLTKSDVYKLEHYRQYRRGMEYVYSYLEARGGPIPATVMFGPHYYVAKFLTGVQVTAEKIAEAERLTNAIFGRPLFNRPGWEQIAAEGGKLPVRIRAVREGTVVPIRNVLMTFENTKKHAYWLTNWLETLMMKVWYPITVASQDREMKREILKWLELTGDPALIDFKLHCFGYRGVSCEEQAGLGGAAHLLNFLGTDTVAAIVLADNYYGSGVCGFSIPATEHSTITSWGRDHEVDAVRNHTENNPTGPIACVGDSYTIYEFCSKVVGTELRDLILNRDGTFVVRPDSGDPLTVVPDCMDLLGEKFGYTVNEKGYKVLDPHVRMIQGDGIKPTTVGPIYAALAARGWSADNLALGSGGGNLQAVTRDTMQFAIKCSWAQVDGEGRDVYKDPITDTGKRSKRGRLALVIGPDGEYMTVPEHTAGNFPGGDQLVTIFEDGEEFNAPTWAEVRDRAALTSSTGR